MKEENSLWVMLPSLIIIYAFYHYVLFVVNIYNTQNNNPWLMVAFCFIGIRGMQISYHLSLIIETIRDLGNKKEAEK